MIKYDLYLLAFVTGLPAGELAAELATYLGATHSTAVGVDLAADFIADYTVHHFGKEVLEKYAPNLSSHEQGQPGVPTDLPNTDNIPPMPSCRICISNK